jgi:multicomponent Na+:H+ antiporter subunit B
VIIELTLFAFLLAIAVSVARMRDLFAAAMLTGIFSLVSAGLFTLMDAVDVAFTEAAVGAGISTILLLGTLSLTDRKERQQPLRLLPFLVVGLTGAALLYGTMDMPAYGDPTAPIHNDLTAEFIQGTRETIHIPNVVTAVLASYRGYDTFGETTVIFAAAVGVMALLGGQRRRGSRDDPEAPS